MSEETKPRTLRELLSSYGNGAIGLEPELRALIAAERRQAKREERERIRVLVHNTLGGVSRRVMAEAIRALPDAEEAP